MTPAQIAAVQRTFTLVLPIKEQAAELFYGRLFTLDPALKPLFKNDMAEQGRKLMAALSTIVVGLNDLPRIVPVAQSLGRRHVGYGVKDGHYDTVGSALLWTLEQGLNKEFTPEVREAWMAAYTTLASVMKAAAKDHTAA